MSNTRKNPTKLVILLFTCVMAMSPAAHAQDSLEEVVLKRAAVYKEKGRLSVGKTTLYGVGLSIRMLELNQFNPLWNKQNTAALMAAINNLDEDGLNPNEYRFPELENLLSPNKAGDLSVYEQVDRELLLSEVYLRAVYNLSFGKVDAVSLDPDINFTRPINKEDPARELLPYIKDASIAKAFELSRPQNPRYNTMKKALVQYREIEAAGGWPLIDSGSTLKPGHTDPRVTQLRDRLQVTGDGPSSVTPNSDKQAFDDSLVDAVKSFQERHGLEADGVVGPATLEALNVPVEARIDQIRVNLERQRWILHEVYEDFLVADIAGFKLYWVDDNKIIWEEKIQVGKFYTKTPLFKSAINLVVFNPDWTIPPGILRRSIIPKLKKDPAYLDKKGYILLTPDGRRVDPKTVDWKSLKGFPYIVRQPPGPDNALGLVKFLFPNPHHVFLHDTNHRELFDRTTRTFSSGCVRLDNPFDLAERLMTGQDGWNRKKIDQTIASGKTKTIKLKKPMRIVIAYGTASIIGGHLNFRPDIYKRDPALLKALDGPFRVRKQDR